MYLLMPERYHGWNHLVKHENSVGAMTVFDFGRGGWTHINGVPHRRWHLFIGRYHCVWHIRMKTNIRSREDGE